MLTHITRPDGLVSTYAGPPNQPVLVREARIRTARPHQERVESNVRKAIERGYGQGLGERYRPWITIRRGLVSPRSNIGVYCTAIHARPLHLLSRLEHTAAILAGWLGAREAREGFPMWPNEHLHPDAASPEAPPAVARAVVPGLLDIARDAGIKHGNYPGTKIPYIATADFLLRSPAGRKSALVLVPVKPYSAIHERSRTQVRTLERLELQRRYANAIGARYIEYTEATCSPLLLSQLEWFSPTHSQLRNLGHREELHRFSEHFVSVQRDLSIHDAKGVAGQRSGIADSRMCQRLFLLGAWLGLINIDFEHHVVMTERARIDTEGKKERLAEHLFGPKESQ